MLSEVLSMSVNLNVVLLDINTRGRLQQYLFNVLLQVFMLPNVLMKCWWKRQSVEVLFMENESQT